MERVSITLVLVSMITIAPMAQPQRKAKPPVHRPVEQNIEDDANEALRAMINGLSKKALVPGRKVFIQPTGKEQLDMELAKELKDWDRWKLVVKEEQADLIITTKTRPCTIIDSQTKERLYIAKPGLTQNLVRQLRKEIDSLPQKPETLLTLTKYLQIREGMDYAEVAKIIGRYGVEQSSSNIGP